MNNCTFFIYSNFIPCINIGFYMPNFTFIFIINRQENKSYFLKIKIYIQNLLDKYKKYINMH